MNETTISTIDARLVLHLCTKNDVNGNPRRLYVEILHGKPISVTREGYGGIPERLSKLPIVRIDVTPAEYRKWRKFPNKA